MQLEKLPLAWKSCENNIFCTDARKRFPARQSRAMRIMRSPPFIASGKVDRDFFDNQNRSPHRSRERFIVAYSAGVSHWARSCAKRFSPMP